MCFCTWLCIKCENNNIPKFCHHIFQICLGCVMMNMICFLKNILICFTHLVCDRNASADIFLEFGGRLYYLHCLTVSLSYCLFKSDSEIKRDSETASLWFLIVFYWGVSACIILFFWKQTILNGVYQWILPPHLFVGRRYDLWLYFIGGCQHALLKFS